MKENRPCFQPTQHKDIITHMAKLADTISVAMARASILWLIGEYSDRVPKIAPDVLRKTAKTFCNEVGQDGTGFLGGSINPFPDDRRFYVDAYSIMMCLSTFSAHFLFVCGIKCIAGGRRRSSGKGLTPKPFNSRSSQLKRCINLE